VRFFWTQGCAKMSEKEGLSVGLCLRILRMRSLASEGQVALKVREVVLVMDLVISARLRPL